MKIGNVITAQSTLEGCHRISQMSDSPVRPVIWPSNIDPVSVGVRELINFPLPKRPLVHFQCNDKPNFSIVAAIPSIENDEYQVRIIVGFVDWDGKLIEQIFPHLDNSFSFSKIELERKKAIEALSHTDYIESQDRSETAQSILRNAHKIGLVDLAFAGFYEDFAFSPYASIKLKPVLKSGFNHKPLPKEWPPIEVVNLRMPEMTDSPQSEGCRKFRIQFSVMEHLRRIIDKEGKERLVKVREHIKGPKDAPLKPKTDRIYKVTK